MKEELQKQIKEAKNGAELRKIIKENIEQLSDEDLEMFAGGCGDHTPCDDNCCLSKNESLNILLG